jgi:signal transduction histidine kinase
MSRTLVLFLLASLLFVFASFVREPDPDEHLERLATSLQKDIHSGTDQLIARTTTLARELDRLGPGPWMTAYARPLEQELARTGTVYLAFRGDSLVAWSGIPAPDQELLGAAAQAHLLLANGAYIHALVRTDNHALHGLRMLWHAPPIENRYLRKGFHPSWDLPNGLLALDSTGPGPMVRDAVGVDLFTLAWRDGALEVGPWLWSKLALASLAVAFLLVWWWQVCMGIARSRPWWGTFLFIGGLAGLRFIAFMALPNSVVARTPVFDPAVYAASPLFASIGDLLINATGLCLASLFLLRAIRGVPLLPGGVFTGTLIVLASLGLGWWSTTVMLGLVNDSSVEMDPYHVQGLDVFSGLALLGMLLLYATWAAVTAALLGCWAPVKRVWTLWTAVVIGGVLHFLLTAMAADQDPILALWPLPPLLVLLHGTRHGHRFLHAVLATALIALSATHLLTRYTGLRERDDRLVLAERLASREDPVVERLFQDIAPQLRTDRIAYDLLAGTSSCTPLELDRTVRQRFFSGYWERYDVRLFAFGPQGEVRCSTDNEPPRSFSSTTGALEFPLAASDMPDLVIEVQPGRGPFYHARVAIMPADTLPPVQLILELHPRTATMGPGFPELLLAGEDPLTRRAARYEHARYENGQLVEASGRVPRPIRWSHILGEDGSLRWQENGMDHLAKGDPAGTLVVLSLPLPRLLDKATSFSYLFAIMCMILGLVLLVRTLLTIGGVPPLGIGSKVRVALVAFAAIALLFFGYGTRRLLTDQYIGRFEAGMLERARSVHQELQNRFDGEPALGDRHAAYLGHLLARLSTVFASDIIVFANDGRLLATSRPQVYAPGLLGRRMDASAYASVVVQGMASYIHDESLGNARYRVVYVPLRDRRGNVLAYIALPGFTDQAQRNREQGGLLVAVANLFVLLFALSVLVAVFISNWTTRPLDLLRNALSRVALQGANEPLRYSGDDEIGRLVEVYNRKVEELRDSAERLARSERESAWREMARQVAHEIKNPLTPMKLSIQHFQRTWSPDAPDAREKLERFSKGMVEQIDTLSGIASAFSDFAQMPRAQAEDLDLAEVAEAALGVFRATPGMHCELRRESTGPLRVYADREQLLRVFNNLLKNAVQSIPDGQEGRITVVLRQADGEAIAEVHDNGTGIAEEDRERIFRPNFTTKGSGMGLGLAMVQRMVEGAGGRVWFESRVGEGSTFHVALPLRR